MDPYPLNARGALLVLASSPNYLAALLQYGKIQLHHSQNISVEEDILHLSQEIELKPILCKGNEMIHDQYL